MFRCDVMLPQFRKKTPQEITNILITYSLHNLSLLNRRLGAEIEAIELRLDEVNARIITLQSQLQNLMRQYAEFLETECQVEDQERKRHEELEAIVGDGSVDAFMTRNVLMQYSPMDHFNLEAERFRTSIVNLQNELEQEGKKLNEVNTDKEATIMLLRLQIQVSKQKELEELSPAHAYLPLL